MALMALRSIYERTIHSDRQKPIGQEHLYPVGDAERQTFERAFHQPYRYRERLDARLCHGSTSEQAMGTGKARVIKAEKESHLI